MRPSVHMRRSERSSLLAHHHLSPMYIRPSVNEVLSVKCLEAFADLRRHIGLISLRPHILTASVRQI